jgi:hypothetical protein
VRRQRTWLAALVVGMIMGFAGGAAAEDWGRFYHYPYSYTPFSYRKPFRSQDFQTPYGYPMYPSYMAFPPYFRTDLYYPYHRHMKPGNNPKHYYQGNHYVLDVF